MSASSRSSGCRKLGREISVVIVTVGIPGAAGVVYVCVTRLNFRRAVGVACVSGEICQPPQGPQVWRRQGSVQDLACACVLDPRT